MYYLYHIEKAGGRSIIHSFLHSAENDGYIFDDEENLSDLYRELCSRKRDFGNKYFHAWQGVIRKLRDNSFFGFSHLPYQEVIIPKGTFKIAILREPLQRLLSHYKMLVRFKKEGKGYNIESDSPIYVKNGFDSFIETFPGKYMQHQLWFWSKSFDIKEAIDNIKKCDLIIFTEKMEDGINELNKKTDLELKHFHVGLGEKDANLSNNQIATLKKCLRKEYQFYESIR